MLDKITKLRINKRILVTFLMGFSSGLPLVLSGGTLHAWLSDEGIDIITIGFLGLVTFPYAFKFLWAPVMDRFLIPILGPRRGWMLLLQIALTLTISLLACSDPRSNTIYIGIVALMLSFLSASQDIVIDAYRTELLHSNEQGLGASLFVTSYRLALIVAGAGALSIAYYWGWHVTYFTMAVLMGLCIFITWYAPEPEQQVIAPRTLYAAVVEPLREFWQRENAVIFLLLIILYKLGDAFATSLMNVFLLKDVGFDKLQVAYMNKFLGVAASIMGAFAGGILFTRITLYQGLLYFGLLQAVSNLMFMWLAMAGKVPWLLAAAVFAENFCGGLGTSAFLTLLMALCNKRYTVFQYALFSALFGAVRVIVSPFTAILVHFLGWPNFFAWTFLISLPGLGLVWFLKDRFVPRYLSTCNA